MWSALWACAVNKGKALIIFLLIERRKTRKAAAVYDEPGDVDIMNVLSCVVSSKNIESMDDSSEESSVEEEVSSSDEEQQEDSRNCRKDGHYPAKVGDLFLSRYFVTRKLGSGFYAIVWLCWDLIEKRFVALKVAKGDKYFYDTALKEIDLLKCVCASDPEDPQRNRVVLMLNSFEISGIVGTHVCTVFELLGHNLRKLVRYEGIPLKNVKTIIRHVLEGLNYLHSKCNMIHADIKLDNVLLCVSEKYIRKLASDALELLSTVKLPVLLHGNISNELGGPAPNANIKISYSKKQAQYYSELLKEQLQRFKMNSHNDRGDMANSATDDLTKTKRLVDRTANGDGDNTPFPKCVLENDRPNGDSNPVDSIVEPIIINGRSATSVDNHGRSATSSRETARSLGVLQLLKQSSLELACDGVDPSQEACEQLRVKVADLGLARWTSTEERQTSSYMPLELLLGADYGTSLDVWSVACLAFELATGENLFERHLGNGDSHDKNHLALIIQLLGNIPKSILDTGKRSSKYFDENGELQYTKKLKPRCLRDVLMEEYQWDSDTAQEFADFLLPMLEYNPNKRATASDCLHHKWLNVS